MIDDNALSTNIETLAVCAHYFALVTGVLMICGGIFKLKRYSDARTFMSQQHTITSPLLMLFAGAALCSFNFVIPVLLDIFWGDQNGQIDIATPSAWSGMRVTPIIYFIRLLGFASFIRGCMTFARHQADSQQGVIGKGLMYLFCGVCLMHIVGVATLVNNTLLGF